MTPRTVHVKRSQNILTPILMVFNPLASDQAWIWDIIALVISFIAVMAVVQITGVLQKRKLIPTLITRKLVHIFVAPVFLVTWLLYSGEWYSRYFAAVVPLLFVLLFFTIGKGIVKNEAFISSMSRSGEASELLRGTLYYAILVLAVTLIWFYVPAGGLANATPIALVVMGCLAGGDGFADVIGRRFGKRKYKFRGSEKSLEGSLGMLLGSVLVTLILVAVFGTEVTAWTMAIFVLPVLLFSIIATVIEAVSPKNLDNWTISIGVVLVMFITYTLTPGFWPYPLF
jgi:phytol kinase